MTYLTGKDQKLIEDIKRFWHLRDRFVLSKDNLSIAEFKELQSLNDILMPMDLGSTLLRIIELRGKALEKAVEQRDEFAESYYGACEAPEPYDNTYANNQLQKIMSGVGE